MLVCAPWTSLWDRNLFASQIVWLTDLMSHEWMRGAVSGVGLVTVVAGLRDLASVFGARRTPLSEPPGPATLP